MKESLRNLPEQIEDFLNETRIAVAGVSRKGDTAANSVLKKLIRSGYEAIPINPRAGGAPLEGVPSYADLKSIPEIPGAVVIATHPDASADVVRQCGESGIKMIWFHRSFGQGSVSDEALQECEKLGIDPIVGGCPLMFCDPVDPVHRLMKWWLQRKGTVPSCGEDFGPGTEDRGDDRRISIGD